MRDIAWRRRVPFIALQHVHRHAGRRVQHPPDRRRGLHVTQATDRRQRELVLDLLRHPRDDIDLVGQGVEIHAQFIEDPRRVERASRIAPRVQRRRTAMVGGSGEVTKPMLGVGERSRVMSVGAWTGNRGASSTASSIPSRQTARVRARRLCTARAYSESSVRTCGSLLVDRSIAGRWSDASIADLSSPITARLFAFDACNSRQNSPSPALTSRL